MPRSIAPSFYIQLAADGKIIMLNDFQYTYSQQDGFSLFDIFQNTQKKCDNSTIRESREYAKILNSFIGDYARRDCRQDFLSFLEEVLGRSSLTQKGNDAELGRSTGKKFFKYVSCHKDQASITQALRKLAYGICLMRKEKPHKISKVLVSQKAG